ncbi:MAG: serine/threonine protein kinase [Candidatus Schekmanbacteria bacterium]|nr:serine/threonine protein kinase [Candidatus Schekmanbacteria bacterium]
MAEHGAGRRPQAAASAAFTDAIQLTPGERIADRYTFVRTLGRGSFGTVYLARDDRDQNLVAIKVLGAASNEPTATEAERRFLQEARTLATVQHRGIVRFVEIGQWHDRLLLVTEFVDGTGLDRVLAQRAPLREEDAAGLLCQALTAVGAVHAAKILHRDLKPANFMLDTGGAAATARLRAGESSRPVVADGTRPGGGNGPIHGARAVCRRGEPGERHLQPRRDVVRDAFGALPIRRLNSGEALLLAHHAHRGRLAGARSAAFAGAF